MTFKKILLALAVTFSFFSPTAWSMMDDSSLDTREKTGVVNRGKGSSIAQDVILEERQDTNKRKTQAVASSLGYFLTSYTKSVSRLTYDVFDFTVHNPTKASMAIIFMACQVVSACDCYCWTGLAWMPQGTVWDQYACNNRCSAWGSPLGSYYNPAPHRWG